MKLYYEKLSEDDKFYQKLVDKSQFLIKEKQKNRPTNYILSTKKNGHRDQTLKAYILDNYHYTIKQSNQGYQLSAKPRKQSVPINCGFITHLTSDENCQS